MNDIVRRLTSREFIVGIFLAVLVILNFERGYGLSQEMVEGIVVVLAGGAALRLASKNGGSANGQ